MDKINVKINGVESWLDSGLKIADLIFLRQIDGMFVIEKNLQIIDKADYSTEAINDGDKIEIVGFAGGG